MFQKTKLLFCIVFALVLTGCGKPKLDYSSTQSAQTSIAKVIEGLSPEKKAEFVQAQSIILSSSLSFLAGPDAVMKVAKEKLHGKTADEVIALAKEIRAKKASPSSSAAPKNTPSAPPPPPPVEKAKLPPPPISAFFEGGKTPADSLIPGTKPDLAGIRIGEPLNLDLITKLNPAYEIRKYQSQDGRESGINASAPNDNLEVMWNEVGLVWHVAREIKLDEEKRFMLDTLRTPLLEKYGQLSDEEHSGYGPPERRYGREQLAWVYDREGKLFSGRNYSSLCSKWGYDNISPPSSFKPNCGYEIQADIFTDYRIKNAVTKYTVRITYVKPTFDELIFKQKEVQLAKQRKLEEETRRVQQNKPQL